MSCKLPEIEPEFMTPELIALEAQIAQLDEPQKKSPNDFVIQVDDKTEVIYYEKLLNSSFNRFDVNESTGWKVLVNKRSKIQEFEKVGNLIIAYITHNSAILTKQQKAILYLHAGQMFERSPCNAANDKKEKIYMDKACALVNDGNWLMANEHVLR